MRTVFYVVGLLLLGSTAVGINMLPRSCPDANDLEYGIVYADPARIGELHRRHRRLEGPFIGTNYINGVFPDGTTVTYSGLFTYKHWRKGKVIQYEEPQTDLSALLRFEPGTEHKFESVRFNPSTPSRKFLTSSTYFIEEADDVRLGDCVYRAVRVRREGTLTMPNQEQKVDRRVFVFVPELMLKVAGHRHRYGDVSAVRKRKVTDPKKWPFTSDAANVLKQP